MMSCARECSATLTSRENTHDLRVTTDAPTSTKKQKLSPRFIEKASKPDIQISKGNDASYASQKQFGHATKQELYEKRRHSDHH